MPLGTVNRTTRELIENWAREYGAPIEALHLEGVDRVERDEGSYEFSDGQEPVGIAVIADGALDEEFTMGSLYAVEVADLIADQCAGLIGSDLCIGYEIVVTEDPPEGEGSIKYVRRSDPLVCKNCDTPLLQTADGLKHQLGTESVECDPDDPTSKIAEVAV